MVLGVGGVEVVCPPLHLSYSMGGQVGGHPAKMGPVRQLAQGVTKYKKREAIAPPKVYYTLLLCSFDCIQHGDLVPYVV